MSGFLCLFDTKLGLQKVIFQMAAAENAYYDDDRVMITLRTLPVNALSNCNQSVKGLYTLL